MRITSLSGCSSLGSCPTQQASLQMHAGRPWPAASACTTWSPAALERAYSEAGCPVAGSGSRGRIHPYGWRGYTWQAGDQIPCDHRHGYRAYSSARVHAGAGMLKLLLDLPQQQAGGRARCQGYTHSGSLRWHSPIGMSGVRGLSAVPTPSNEPCARMVLTWTILRTPAARAASITARVPSRLMLSYLE
jgi:hypothetical protein